MQEIEALRKELINLAQEKGELNQEVVEASKKLDQELNKYYRMLQNKNNGE